MQMSLSSWKRCEWRLLADMKSRANLSIARRRVPQREQLKADMPAMKAKVMLERVALTARAIPFSGKQIQEPIL